MSSYLGKHAGYYDIFYADKPYAEEAAFVHDCLQRFSSSATSRLLELACGTGTHAMELEKLGYQVVATDYSEDMLACARQKAEARGSAVDFRWQDMRALDIAENPFDAVICLFDSIGYVQTNEALMEVLKGVHRHLRSEGLFVFEFWHAAAMLRNHEPVRIRRWSTPEGELLRISETELEHDKQLATVTYSIYELRNNGTYTYLNETQMNRYFLLQEMEAWISICGFKLLKYFSGFTFDERISASTWHVVAIARRGGDQ